MSRRGAIGLCMMFMILLSVCAYNVTGGINEIIMQPNATMGIDAFVNQNLPDNNYGDLSFLVGAESGGEYAASLLRFTELEDIPNYANVTSAILKLYFYDSPTNPTNAINLSVRKITSDWDESTVTWNNKPSYSAQYSDKITLIDSYGWIELDVTDGLQNIVNGSSPNYGLAIVPDAVTASTEKRFYSSDHSNASLHPKLEVNYTTTDAPVITIIWPINNTQHGDGDLKIGYNVTSEENIANCSLINANNGNIIDTSNTITKDTLQLFTKTIDTEGTYYFNVSCTDTTGNIGTSETLTAYINTSKADLYGKVKDSQNNDLDVTINFIQDNTTRYNSTGALHSVTLDDGFYDIEIIPSNHTVSGVMFNNISISKSFTKVVDLDEPSDDQGFNKIYAVNPLIGNTSDTFTVTATASAGSTMLYKCSGWNFTAQTCEGNWIAWQTITPGQEYNVTFYIGDPGLAEDQWNGTFFDGFESGAISGNWSQGGTADWIASTTNPYTGTYCALSSSSTSGESILQSNISTSGYSNITFTFYYAATGLDTGEYIYGEWYNGTDWIIATNWTAASNNQDKAYTLSNTSLTSDADNNADFKIRFRCYTGSTSENCRVDNIQVIGNIPDTTNPSSVTNLNNQSANYDWIYWNWTNPTSDFGQAIVHLDGVNVQNTTNNYYNATGLTVGTEYTLTVHTKDLIGNVNNSDVNSTASTLVDTTPPNWNQTPTDQNVSYGDNFSYQVAAYDSVAIDVYFINYTTNFVINSTTGLITNSTFLSIGSYSLNISVNDTSGNINSEIITITVQDITSPVWNPAPEDQINEYGENFSYDVSATDLQAITYSVNDTINFAINSSTGLITNNTVISVAVYYLEINATDLSGNVNSTTITITVQDTISPSWTTAPVSEDVHYGEVFSQNISATDLNGISRYFINDTANFRINETTGEMTNNTLLSTGGYELNVSVNDTFSNLLSKIISINVLDAGYPEWNPVPEDMMIGYGLSFFYDANATDDLGIDTYFINDTLNFMINASSGVLTNNTLLSLGVYDLNMSINDTSGNINSKIITITVHDIVVPWFDPVPENQTLEYGDAFSYDINGSDDVGIGGYSINDTANFAIDSVTGLVTNNTALNVGSYDLNITINDTCPITNNKNSTIITITVQDTITPTWDEIFTNQIFRYGENFSYDVNATDLQTITYSINDTSNFIIGPATGIIINNSNPSARNYSLEINATDASGNVNSSTINITIQEADAPVITSTAPTNGSSLSSGTTFYLIQLTTDEQAICRYSTSDVSWSSMTQMATTNATTHLQTIVGLSDGNSYDYYFLCEDTNVLVNRMDSSYYLTFSVSGPSSPPSSPPSGGSSGGGGGGYFVCVEEWNCTDWGECIDGTRTRTCVDSRNCSTTDDKPAEIEECGIFGPTVVVTNETNVFGDIIIIDKISAIIPEGGSIIFYYHDKQYILELTKCGEEVAEFKIIPDGRKFALETLEIENIDLDRNGISDISLTLKGIEQKRPRIIIKHIKKPLYDNTTRITGKTISIKPYAGTSPSYTIPLIFLVLSILILVSIRRSKVSKKVRNIITAAHVGLTLAILALSLNYQSSRGITGLATGAINRLTHASPLDYIRLALGAVMVVIFLLLFVVGKGDNTPKKPVKMEFGEKIKGTKIIFDKMKKAGSKLKQEMIRKKIHWRPRIKEEQGAKQAPEAGKSKINNQGVYINRNISNKEKMINEIKEVYKNET